jgi:hypothetical protein
MISCGKAKGAEAKQERGHTLLSPVQLAYLPSMLCRLPGGGVASL